MDFDQFSALLVSLRITKRELCRKLGIEPHTVSRWKYSGVPTYAVAYLREIEFRNKLADSFVRKLEQGPTEE